MTKSSINSFFEEYESIGFDIDGTIYDELSFIAQSYIPVSVFLSKKYNINQAELYSFLIEEWNKKGSSFPVFQIVMKNHYDIDLTDEAVAECVSIYRNCDFQIKPYDRIVELLEFLSNKNKKLFIVTDGNEKLQKQKILSLGLNKWFRNSDIYISGSFGRDFQKPSIKMAEEIKKTIGKRNKVIFVGDRSVDQDFARNANFDFLNIRDILKNE